MGDTFRGFGDMLVKFSIFVFAMIGASILAGYFFLPWLEKTMGKGTSGPLVLIIAGGLGVLLVVVVISLLINMIHRSAGDDIVAVVAGLADVFNNARRVDVEVTKGTQARLTQKAKTEHEEEKARIGLMSFFRKRDAKQEEKEAERLRKAQEEANAIDVQWDEINDLAGDDFGEVDYIE